jgi:hypothetical protein
MIWDSPRKSNGDIFYKTHFCIMPFPYKDKTYWFEKLYLKMEYNRTCGPDGECGDNHKILELRLSPEEGVIYE